MFPCFPVKITKSWNLFFVPYDKGFASSLEFISFGGSYSTKIFGDQVFYRSTSINLYLSSSFVLLSFSFCTKNPHPLSATFASCLWVDWGTQTKQTIYCVISYYELWSLYSSTVFYAAGQSSTSSESSHSVMEHFSKILRSISTFIRPQTSCTLCLKSTKPFTNFSIRLAECS